VPDWLKIGQKISSSVGEYFQLKKQSAIGGGDINQAYRIDGVIEENNQNKAVSFFIKLNQKSQLDMFAAEAAGLQEIEKAQAIRVPHVICSGVEKNQSYLVLENLSLVAG